MTAAISVLHYLKFTADFQLHFNSNRIGIGIGIDRGNSLVGYVDSNWANDRPDHKSQGGDVSLASKGGAVSWESQKQGLIAMSTLEPQFIAFLEAF